MPVIRDLIELEVAPDLIELSPPRSKSAEPTLPEHPSLVIRGTQSIPSCPAEEQADSLVLPEVWELRTVRSELERERIPLNRHLRRWGIGLCVPALI